MSEVRGARNARGRDGEREEAKRKRKRTELRRPIETECGAHHGGFISDCKLFTASLLDPDGTPWTA